MLRRPDNQPRSSRLPRSLTIRKKSDFAPLDRLLQNSELDLETAADELRWMREATTEKALSQDAKEELLQEMIELRADGKPLQYILGM